MLTICFTVCCWPQSHDGDLTRLHLCKFARHGPWPVRKRRDHCVTSEMEDRLPDSMVSYKSVVDDRWRWWTDPNHVLSSLLPDKTDQHYYRRTRHHHRQLVDKRNKLFSNNFMIHMLYADACERSVERKKRRSTLQPIFVIPLSAPFPLRDLPLRAPLTLQRFLSRSAPFHPIFSPLRSVFRSAHMLWLYIDCSLFVYKLRTDNF